MKDGRRYCTGARQWPANSAIKPSTTALRGQRTAMRPVFAVTFSGTRCDAATTNVNAPGQKAFANREKLGGTLRVAVPPAPRNHQERQTQLFVASFDAENFIHGRQIERIGCQSIHRVVGMATTQPRSRKPDT